MLRAAARPLRDASQARASSRGCIGTLVARGRPDADGARSSRLRARLRRSRGSRRSTAGELPELPHRDLRPDRAGPSWRTPETIEVGRDGLILEARGRRGLLLPPGRHRMGLRPRTFLVGGLPAGRPSARRLAVAGRPPAGAFQAEVFVESAISMRTGNREPAEEGRRRRAQAAGFPPRRRGSSAEGRAGGTAAAPLATAAFRESTGVPHRDREAAVEVAIGSRPAAPSPPSRRPGPEEAGRGDRRTGSLSSGGDGSADRSVRPSSHRPRKARTRLCPDTGIRSTLPALARHRARVEEVGGARRGSHDPRRPPPRRLAHDRPEVAGVLDAEDEDDRARPAEDSETATSRRRTTAIRCCLASSTPGPAARGLPRDLPRPRRGDGRELARRGRSNRGGRHVLEGKPGRRGLEDRLLSLQEEMFVSPRSSARLRGRAEVRRRLDHGHGQACYNRRG